MKIKIEVYISLLCWQRAWIFFYLDENVALQLSLPFHRSCFFNLYIGVGPGWFSKRKYYKTQKWDIVSPECQCQLVNPHIPIY